MSNQDKLSLVFTHNMDALYKYPELVQGVGKTIWIGGHIHWGQGMPEIVLDTFVQEMTHYNSRYIKGWYDIDDNTKVYIDRGASSHRDISLDIPEIAVFRLKYQKDANMNISNQVILL